MTTLVKIHPDPEELADIIAARRARGETIVFGNGCFDILHVGHVRYLEAARELGDVLVIGVNTEASIRTNPDRETPVTPLAERMEMLAALAAVDYVVPFDEPTPAGLIELFRPHVQAKGTDYTLADMPERELMESIGGRIEFVGDEKTHSSTELRAVLRDREERGVRR